MERRRQTRGNCLCSAALSGAASELGPLGISVGMPNITFIPQQQNSPTELFGFFFFFRRSWQGCPELLEVSTVLVIIKQWVGCVERCSIVAFTHPSNFSLRAAACTSGEQTSNLADAQLRYSTSWPSLTIMFELNGSCVLGTWWSISHRHASLWVRLTQRSFDQSSSK